MPGRENGIRGGVHPGEWTRQYRAMRAQLKRLGLAIEWTREFRRVRA
jgi:leucyl-tRNA synthetase